MITKRIIPCLDVKNGRVVKGVKFEGLSDVSSPVELGKYYSENGADEDVYKRQVLKDAVVVALVLTAAIVAFSNLFNDGIVALFNKSGDPLLQSIAKEGITIYFLGFFPGSLNIVLAGYLSAMEKAAVSYTHLDVYKRQG